MKYYDGMGTEVTEYVNNLEKQVQQLKEDLAKLSSTELEQPVVLEQEKPKRKRRIEEDTST